MGDLHKPLDARDGRAGEAVVLIHGIWMPAAAMTLLARRLRGAGWSTHLFSYSSRRAAVKRNAAALAAFLKGIDAPVVHFVAHSMGGLLLMQLFQDYPAQRPGRAVLLGTPYRGSHAARRLSRYRWARWLCGLSLQGGLLGDGVRWTGGRELGVIAGSLPFGLGWMVPGMPRPYDGMVAVEETAVPGAADGIVLPVSHSGMLISSSVARQVVLFLDSGHFAR